MQALVHRQQIVFLYRLLRTDLFYLSALCRQVYERACVECIEYRSIQSLQIYLFSNSLRTILSKTYKDVSNFNLFESQDHHMNAEIESIVTLCIELQSHYFRDYYKWFIDLILKYSESLEKIPFRNQFCRFNVNILLCHVFVASSNISVAIP